MSAVRNLRRWITAGATSVAARVAPTVPGPVVDLLQWTLGRTGPMLPVMAHLVRTNMRAAGVYERKVFRDYFRHVAAHLLNGIRLFGLKGNNDAVAAIARREVDVDPSIDRLVSASESGRGAVIAPAHACNFLISLARLRQEVPLCIYLRWSDNRRKLAMKRQWCEAVGLDVIIEPSNATDPTSRAAACAEALRAGKLLAITPDIAQKATEGIPVEWLGRRAFLPTGPAALAMLADVPMIPLFARYRGDVHVCYCDEPLSVEAVSRDEGGRKEALRRAMQCWADGFSRFIRDCPQAWFLWGDSRWTRVLRGDPKYGGPLQEVGD